jgi:hypothetical protein
MERPDETDDGPDFETREEWAAAAEAAAIGGARDRDLGPAGTDEKVDEALRPVYEAGGGDQEGFEIAEHDLERNASHDDGAGFPERDAFTPERESDRSGAEYGEADEEDSQDR